MLRSISTRPLAAGGDSFYKCGSLVRAAGGNTGCFIFKTIPQNNYTEWYILLIFVLI